MTSPATAGHAVVSDSRSRVLRAELSSARHLTDNLFELISPEALYARPIAERHRLIFYLGHVDAFDWNQLAIIAAGESGFHPEFDKLFERGIDPEPGRAARDSPLDWPSRAEVDSYISKTRSWIDSHLADIDPKRIEMTIEHRLMHAETLAYLLHNLPHHEKLPAAYDPVPFRPSPSNPMIEIAAGTALLGNGTEEFGWDNEYRAHEVYVPGFRISKYKISNGEYLEFVRAGGPTPHFWSSENGAYFWRGMFSQFPLPLDGPAWVTWQQASAYAQWRGLKLPTEAQFQRAASLTRPDPRRDNFDSLRWDPVAVDAGSDAGHDLSAGNAPAQMTGNGWEWTRDVFAPFEGFVPQSFYPGYSADFFDGQHFVMKGASPRTPGRLSRSAFRNWFRPDYPYMYTGFRLVEN
jgi:iron(II)-dependent oxidoreductase